MSLDPFDLSNVFFFFLVTLKSIQVDFFSINFIFQIPFRHLNVFYKVCIVSRNLIMDIRGTLMLCMRFKCDGGAFMGSKKNGRVSKGFKIHDNDSSI